MVTIFAGVMQRAGVRFVFSPIPEPGEVYPELYDAAERSALPATSFLDALLAGVGARGIEAVDLRAVYRGSREPYLYLPDDSHWNARATELAAAAWASAIADGSQIGFAAIPARR
jgi:hypothetical protein